MRTDKEKAIHQQLIDYVQESNITVAVKEIYGTVAIECPEGTLAFLQGDEGETFIAERRLRWNSWEDISMSELNDLMAYDYADLEPVQ